jgi:hypothetical protein
MEIHDKEHLLNMVANTQMRVASFSIILASLLDSIMRDEASNDTLYRVESETTGLARDIQSLGAAINSSRHCRANESGAV